MHFHWFLPTAGDSHGITSGGQAAATVVTERPPELGYLALIARAAERLGFVGVLTPTGTFCEDAWLTTAALIGETSTLKFLVAFRPGFLSPTLTGKHFQVEGATVRAAPDPVPPVFFGGSSPPALRVAAEHVDTYLTWGEPPAAVEAKLTTVRKLADEHNRTLSYGIRLHVISRDTAAEAWAEARALLARVPPDAVTAAKDRFARTESEGQRRMTALTATANDDLEVSPNLWAGFGLIRPGAGTALVGSHAEVADRITEYHALGIDHFIMSGQPHLEEAYRFGENVLPRLRTLQGDP